MNDLEKNGNLIEAVIWLVFTVFFAFKTWRSTNRWRKLFGILTAAFFVFAISDVIEARTGAWWTPFWLLLMKAACIAVFVCGIWEYRQIKKSESALPVAEDRSKKASST